jgi:hypothetical protein
MVLLVVLNGLLAATSEDSWGAARPCATLDSDAAHGRRGDSRGGGSRGAERRVHRRAEASSHNNNRSIIG